MKWWGWGEENVSFTHEGKPELAPFIERVLRLDVRRPGTSAIAVAVVDGHLLGSDGVLEVRPQSGREHDRRDLQVLEGDGAGARPAYVEAEVALDEGRQLGPALVGEGDVFLAPAPPFHRRRCRSALVHAWAGPYRRARPRTRRPIAARAGF